MADTRIDQDVARFGSFSSSAVTHAGTANRLNEDGFVNRPDLGLWAVADGAGGHESGEVASAEVVSSLQTIEPGLSAAEMLVEVRSRLEQAHSRLREAASQRGADVLMATTVVVLLARDDHFACLWAGAWWQAVFCWTRSACAAAFLSVLAGPWKSARFRLQKAENWGAIYTWRL